MPLRAMVYQADLMNHGRKDHHTSQSFFGGSYDENDSYYDPFNTLNSQTQNCSYAAHSCWPEKENNNIPPSPCYIQKKGTRKVSSRRHHETNEKVVQDQRLTHIVVERNRRKQVNEYLSTLRSLMPQSYTNKGDQASIVGGAINYVKELEQKLQCLESHKRTNNSISINNSYPSSFPFSDCITPSYQPAVSDSWSILEKKMNVIINDAVNVDVSVAECFANLKIRAVTGQVKKQLLLRMLEHLDECNLTVLHLNVCSLEQVVLYTICLKVEDECNLTSGDDIATDVHQFLATSIQHKADMGWSKFDTCMA